MNKHEIMKVLLLANNNLTQEQINWADKNLPNRDEPIKYIAYDHEKKNLLEAAGVSNEREYLEYKQLKSEFINKIAKKSFSKSEFVEFIESNASPILIRAFFIEGIFNFENQSINISTNGLKEIEKHLNELEKLLKNFKDNE